MDQNPLVKPRYLFNWLENRLEFLDEYFNEITSVNEEFHLSTLNVFPNPAVDYISFNGEFKYC